MTEAKLFSAAMPRLAATSSMAAALFAHNVAPAFADHESAGLKAVAASVSPESQAISATDQAIINHNTIKLTDIGCSGAAIPDKRHRVAVVATAVHCNLTTEKAPRTVGSDGHSYIVQPKPIEAQTGRRADRMKTVATINRWILPGTVEVPDLDHDLALGVPKGVSVKHAIDTWEQNSIPTEKVKYGEQLVDGAWPQAQPASKHPDVMERQSFNMRVIRNIGFKQVNNKENVRMLFATMPATEDGAECSYGASGSTGFVRRNHKIKYVGVLSYFDDLTSSLGEYNQLSFKAFEPTGNTASICGFSDQLAKPGEGGEVVRAVTDLGKVPGYETDQQIIADIHRDFNDPTIAKTVLKGTVVYPHKGGGPMARREADLATETGIHDPVLFESDVPKTNIMAYYDATSTEPDHLGFIYQPEEYSYLSRIYPDAGDEAPSFSATSGAITFDTQNNVFSNNGRVFGDVINGYTIPDAQAYELEFDHGAFHAEPMMKR